MPTQVDEPNGTISLNFNPMESLAIKWYTKDSVDAFRLALEQQVQAYAKSMLMEEVEKSVLSILALPVEEQAVAAASIGKLK
jgi:hypothetical protein